MVERAGFEIRCSASRYRGFESHLLRYQSRSDTFEDRIRPGSDLEWDEAGVSASVPISKKAHAFKSRLR